MTAASQKKIRKKIRFSPDPSQHAEIDFNSTHENFRCELPALIFNESYNGCCVIALKDKRFKIQGRFKIKVGLLSPLLGEIRWITELDNDFVKLGVEFLE